MPEGALPVAARDAVGPDGANGSVQLRIASARLNILPDLYEANRFASDRPEL